MRANVKSNEYQRAYPGYASTPKAIIAAIAYSFAMRIAEDDEAYASRLIQEEWGVLYDNGIVLQKPKA